MKGIVVDVDRCRSLRSGDFVQIRLCRTEFCTLQPGDSVEIGRTEPIGSRVRLVIKEDDDVK